MKRPEKSPTKLNGLIGPIVFGVVAMCLAGAAEAQAPGRLTVTLDKVPSAKGSVIAALCSSSAGGFPGGCGDYRVDVPAKQGSMDLVFEGVKPGTYAVQIFHDENGNKIPNIPPEGYGYSNNQPFPPDFAKASLKVEGDTRTQVTLLTVQGQMGAAAPKLGSKGAPAAAGVTKTDVRDGGLYAEFYVPEHQKPLPAVILMGGSEGGLDTMSRMAESFTSNGYAVFVLAYFQELGLPQTLENIPLEYFDKAVAWVKAWPEVDPKRIGAVGGSRGSEAVLLLGSRNKDVHAVMAFAPSGVMWAGLGDDYVHPKAAWTLAGKPLPFANPDGTAFKGPAEPMRPMFEGTLAKKAPPASLIEVEKINGPVLLLSGEADELWPSTPMANSVIERLKEKKFKFAYNHYSYPGAGHLIFMGDPSHLPANFNPGVGGLRLGGTPDAYRKAWTDDWPKTLKFFDDALKGKS